MTTPATECEVVMSKKSENEYWEDYNNLQHVKHELIRNYLNGWLPKLTLGDYGSGRVLYFDTHAGRGKHAKGQLGSPLVALETVLDHTFFPKLDSEVKFFFIEENEDNHAALKDELKAYKKLPKNVAVHCHNGECFEVLKDILATLKKDGKQLAPSFIFCDPFGFKVPFSVLDNVPSIVEGWDVAPFGLGQVSRTFVRLQTTDLRGIHRGPL